MKSYIQILITLGLIALIAYGCTAGPGEQRQTATGALIGAGAGAIAGNNIKGVSTTEGAVAGAVIGGLIGNTTGKQQDQVNAQQAQINAIQAEQNRSVVHITNSNGSMTPVVLHRVGQGQWQGPKGEIYNTLPGPEQLKTVYGF